MDAGYFVEGIDEWFDVMRWPRWLRRAFILTLPISAPIYVCALFATMIVGIVWFVVAVIFSAWQ